METQRLTRQSLMNFLAALLGSVFGLMGTFSIIMSSIEDFISIYSKKISKHKFKRDFDERMKRVYSQFKSKTDKSKQNKIIPMTQTVASL